MSNTNPETDKIRKDQGTKADVKKRIAELKLIGAFDIKEPETATHWLITYQLP